MSQNRVSLTDTQPNLGSLISQEQLKRLIMSWEKSPRVEVEKIGLSYMKIDTCAVIIGYAENMRAVERIRFAGKKLTTPCEESRKVQQW